MKTKEREIHMDLKTKIEKVLSEILSDRHECKVTLHFEKRENTNEATEKANQRTKNPYQI